VTTQWRDEEGRKLEQRLTEIIIGIAVAGEHLHRQWIKERAECERKRQEEAEREAQRCKAEEEERERRRLAAIEKAKVDKLRRDAHAWHEAKAIRAYVEAVRKASDLTDATACEAWARWAMLEADRLDPIGSGRALALTNPRHDEDEL
jgi:hypothetical protein